jgi:hypothetical protein
MVGDLVAKDAALTNGYGAVVKITLSADSSKIVSIVTSTQVLGASDVSGGTGTLVVLRIITGSVECLVTDTPFLIASTWNAVELTVDSNAGGVLTLMQGNSAANAKAENLAVGDKILVWKDMTNQQIFTVSRLYSSGTGIVETVETTIAGLQSISGQQVYRYGRGTNEKSVCSGRGLCDTGSGTCKCFKGYAMDDCSRQNTLAL